MNRVIRVSLSTGLLLACALVISACGDGNQNEDVPGDVTDVVESDIADVVGDEGTPDVPRDTNVEDTTDVVCVCNTTDECCDGCAFINEGGNCELADAEIGFCQVTVCQSGACVLADRVCEPDNKCAFYPGTCDPEDGSCSYIEVMGKANGEVCEALAGIDGSGACLFGVCEGFPACDFRAYDQAAGMPCNFDSECASGLCRAYGYGWDHFCSQSCEGGVACPDGLRCVKDVNNEYFCERIGDAFPGDGSIAMFKPCNIDGDCAGGLCLGYGTTRFCTADCASGGSVCGDCGDCVSGGTEKGFAFENYCVPDSDGQPGDVCQSPMDCSRNFCYEGYCSDQCFIFSEELDSCPEGFKCILGAYAEDLQTCVAITSLNKVRGDVCAHDYECVSTMCRAIGETSICVDTCENCTGGDCVQIGWQDTDTVMELWKDGGEAAMTSDDDGGDGMLSKLGYYINEAGTYYIHVKGNSDTIVGPYVLSVAFEGGVELAVEADEVEANNDMAGAEAKTVPFLVNAQLEAAGHDWFKFEVTIPEGQTSIRLNAETIPLADNACVPSTMDGTTPYGGECAWEWQCMEGFDCLEGMCNKTCEMDTDCPDGICFAYSDTDSRCVPAALIGQKEVQDPCMYSWECTEQCFGDEYLGEAYCTVECDVDDDCVYGMGCLDGLCNKGFPTPNFPYGYCRINADCESYICTDGMCSADCEADSDCEGNAAIVPEGPKELCSSCTTNDDCNEGTEDMYTMSYCVQVSETEMFCAPQCTFDEGGCPEGTRCYSLDYFTKVCAPVSFTCQAGGVGCAEEISTCVRPFVFDGEICRYDAECIGGKCADGICRTETCDGTIECGCDLLECVDDYCVFTAAANRELEVEPNNTVETAQFLMSIPVKVVGGFNTDGMAAMDNDLYKIQLVQGYAYNFVMSEACETDSDPAMILRDASGAYIEGFAIDDYGTSYFPAIFGYLALSDEVVYLEIVQSPWVEGFLRQPYVLDVAIFMPESGDNCGGATALLNPTEIITMEQPDFDNATDSATAPTQMGELFGPDLFRYVDVPARDPGSQYREYTLAMAPTPVESDIAMWAFTDCADVDGSLVSWSNFNIEDDWKATEAITLLNDTDAVKRFYIGFNAATNVHTYVHPVLISQNPAGQLPPQGDTAAAPISIPGTIDQFNLYGQNAAYPWGSDIAPTGGACEGLDLSGKDIVFKVSVPAETFIKTELAYTYMNATILVIDARDMTTCQKAGFGPLYYMPAPNETDPGLANDVYLVVKTMNGHPGGMFRIESTVMEVGDCAGPCDSATATASCLDDKDFCQCNATTGFWETLDCAAACVDGGYSVGGACHTYSTGTGAGKQGCMCEYDCTIPGIVENMCGYGSYTNCTCDSSDPCAWIDDATCDEFCTNEYENGFDDPVDCTPVED